MNEPDVSSLITVADAIRIIDSTPVIARPMRLKLVDAHGQRLADEILADRDSPAFDKSLMDGYAVRAADVTARENQLRCVGEVAAGAKSDLVISTGETVAIMTGAPLPRGADAVIPVEMRRSIEADLVTIQGPAVAGRFIATRGSDWHAGDVVLPRGVKLEAAQLAVAASVGANEVDAFARPRVGVLATGDEIVPIDQVPGPSQIRNSNSLMLVSLLRRLGCDVTDLGMVSDDRDRIRNAIAHGIDAHDVLFITGGMSMGEHDYVPGVLRELGVELKITKLRIKPGKPFVFGSRRNREATAGDSNERFVFGLPGNPVSAFMCTLRLCSRLLARIAGGETTERWITAQLAAPLAPNGPREFYQPAVMSAAGKVQPLAWKSSADLVTLAAANVVLVRPADDPARAAGELVNTLEVPT